jgi:hypothetical protein
MGTDQNKSCDTPQNGECRHRAGLSVGSGTETRAVRLRAGSSPARNRVNEFLCLSALRWSVLLICGLAAGTGTTGTLYEPDETPPSYSGAPTTAAPYVWVCDTFYQVSSGGQTLETDRGTIQVAFDRPTVRGFERREQAVAAAKSHIRQQFNRIGIDTEPEFHVDTPQEATHVHSE